MVVWFDCWSTLGIAEKGDLIKALRIHRRLFQLRIRHTHVTGHTICIIVGPHHGKRSLLCIRFSSNEFVASLCHMGEGAPGHS